MNLDDRIRNFTPFTAHAFALEDRHGRSVATVVAKIRYGVNAHGVVSLDRLEPKVHTLDVPSGSSAWAGLLHASDRVDEKPGTDVLMIGTAHPAQPGDTSVDVTVRVEAGRTSGALTKTPAKTLTKTVRVHGARVWCDGLMGLAPGPALPLMPTPLVWELTYGGRVESGTEPLVEWRNPAGSGLVNDRSKLVGQRVPPIEDPSAPIGSRKPAPASFAPIAAEWSPRRELTGTHDETWARTRAPIRPIDFDPRHHSVAAPELWSETPLFGDEPIEVVGARPEGPWRFALPRFSPSFFAEIEEATLAMETHLDTISIDADACAVELTWRASIPLPKKSDGLRTLHVTARERIPEELLHTPPTERRTPEGRVDVTLFEEPDDEEADGESGQSHDDRQ